MPHTPPPSAHADDRPAPLPSKPRRGPKGTAVMEKEEQERQLAEAEPTPGLGPHDTIEMDVPPDADVPPPPPSRSDEIPTLVKNDPENAPVPARTKGSEPPPAPEGPAPSEARADSMPPLAEPEGLGESITLVNATDHVRVQAEIVHVTRSHLYVLAEGIERRISRVACFEHPPGGSWSVWRLSGADRHRWQVTKKSSRER